GLERARKGLVELDPQLVVPRLDRGEDQVLEGAVEQAEVSVLGLVAGPHRVELRAFGCAHGRPTGSRAKVWTVRCIDRTSTTSIGASFTRRRGGRAAPVAPSLATATVNCFGYMHEQM